jgi:hypothetical protein
MSASPDEEKVRVYWPTCPLRPSPSKLTTPWLGLLDTDPERTALVEPTAATETETVAPEVTTVLPEMSLIATTGAVPKPARFTAPVAEVVRTSSVADPADTFTTLVMELKDKLATLAVTFLLPVDPRNFSPVKVATPEEAFLTRVPVSSGAELASDTDGVPVVTRLPSASFIRTTTSEIPLLFTALEPTVSSTVVAAPWSKVID